MGCCGSAYPKNQEIENAINRAQLVDALKNVSKKFGEEIKDIESHLSKNTPIKTYGIDELPNEDLKLRSAYLKSMDESVKELCTVINGCTDDLPLKETKNYLQDFLQHYFVAYDQNNGYLKEVNGFKQFASSYRK